MPDMSDDKFTLRIDAKNRARWEEAARREGFLKAGDQVNLGRVDQGHLPPGCPQHGAAGGLECPRNVPGA
jgi:hypothetical protein